MSAATPGEDQIEEQLQHHVEVLSKTIGERGPFRYPSLEQARKYIERILTDSGYAIDHDVYGAANQIYRNIIVEERGQQHPQRIFVTGAHYDTVPGTPGADDNASGVAVLLELARLVCRQFPATTLRFVAFTLEEPPYFRTSLMGSLVHAERCREKRERIMGMASLEMVGYFSEDNHSQEYPLPFMRWFYSSQGNFIAVAGNWDSRRLVRRVTDSLKATTRLAVASTALPFVPAVGLSDNWSFWQQGYPAFMITDTSFFRNPHYHLPSDRAQTLDYERMAELVKGLARILLQL
jgi:Zn-dependent M28 family amino/carboxypeptidase